MFLVIFLQIFCISPFVHANTPIGNQPPYRSSRDETPHEAPLEIIDYEDVHDKAYKTYNRAPSSFKNVRLALTFFSNELVKTLIKLEQPNLSSETKLRLLDQARTYYFAAFLYSHEEIFYKNFAEFNKEWRYYQHYFLKLNLFLIAGNALAAATVPMSFDSNLAPLTMWMIFNVFVMPIYTTHTMKTMHLTEGNRIWDTFVKRTVNRAFPDYSTENSIKNADVLFQKLQIKFLPCEHILKKSVPNKQMAKHLQQMFKRNY